VKPPSGGFFVVRRKPLKTKFRVHFCLTARDIVQIMHAHTLHVGVVGVLALLRLWLV
jgi:hypothetical protein